jgi:thiol:disulfide interchange protein DsbG
MPKTPARLLFPVLATLILAVAGCSKTGEASAPAATTAPAAAAAPAAMTGSAYDTAASTGKGFTVGAMMSAQPVYVLFEPSCPHCGHLWEASKALQGKVKFIWIPVAFNQGKSLAQAATLLSSSTPLETMSEHEKSVLAGTGGIAASSSVPPELEQAIKANTQLLATLGQDSVPFVVAKNRHSGEVITHTGAMDTDALAKFLGVE